MSNSGGKITAPVSIEDVRTVLGVSSYDLGTLCKSEKINMWAKYKPVRVPMFNELYESEFNEAQYGLHIPSSSSLDSVINTPWSHAAPRGGDSEPYRLTDFDKYNHVSEFIISGNLNPKYDCNSETGDLYIGALLWERYGQYNLNAKDLPLLMKMRLGLRIDGNKILTSKKTVADVIGDSQLLACVLNPKSVGKSSFTIEQFLTTENYPSLSTFPTVIQCYSVPNYTGKTNSAVVNYTEIGSGITFKDQYMSNELNGAYQTEDYYMTTPFVVSYNGDYSEYWKTTCSNSRSTKVTVNVTDFTFHGYDVNGNPETETYNEDLKMYNSNKQQVYSVDIPANGSVTLYFKTRMIGNNYSSYNTRTNVFYAEAKINGHNQNRIMRFELNYRCN